jgi:hypothetical protein
MNYFTLLFGQTSSTATDPAIATGIGLSIMIVWLVFMAFGLTAFVFWIIALIHVLQHHDVKDRVLWIVLLLVLGSMVGVVYYFAVQRVYEKGGMRDPNYQPPKHHS